MRRSICLLQSNVRLTLFTRPNCGLCTTAKTTIGQVSRMRDVEYDEIDIMSPGQEKWKNLYEFDVPVVKLQADFLDWLEFV